MFSPSPTQATVRSALDALAEGGRHWIENRTTELLKRAYLGADVVEYLTRPAATRRHDQMRGQNEKQYYKGDNPCCTNKSLNH
jgi:hypothetical protein